MPLVAVIMGSKNDNEMVKPCLDALESLGISYESAVMSAHRTPEKVRQFALTAHGRGVEVIIACAGGAAHLPGQSPPGRHYRSSACRCPAASLGVWIPSMP